MTESFPVTRIFKLFYRLLRLASSLKWSQGPTSTHTSGTTDTLCIQLIQRIPCITTLTVTHNNWNKSIPNYQYTYQSPSSFHIQGLKKDSRICVKFHWKLPENCPWSFSLWTTLYEKHKHFTTQQVQICSFAPVKSRFLDIYMNRHIVISPMLVAEYFLWFTGAFFMYNVSVNLHGTSFT